MDYKKNYKSTKDITSIHNTKINEGVHIPVQKNKKFITAASCYWVSACTPLREREE